MNKFLRIAFLLLLTFSIIPAYAGSGDTISVVSHNKVHMGGHGAYDRWVVFPKDTQSFERVILYYTIGCPTSGCSDWDYTNRIILRNRPGYKDSTLAQAPSFKVNGQTKDSLRYLTRITYNYLYDTVLMKVIDSTAHPVQTIILFEDSTKPLIATDTISGWLEGYSYTLDNSGKRIDSVFNASTQVLRLKLRSYYNVFDKIIEYEMARAITPYGGNLANSWSITYKLDVTDFISLLHDSAEIRSFYDGWSDGFAVTLDFKFIKGKPFRKPYKIIQLWDGGFPYGNPANSIENYLVANHILIDSNAKHVKLRILQTGHSFGSTENCAEFCPKYNYIMVNGVERYSNYVWKPDCGMNPIYPQAGTWVYDRANWCPGLDVKVFENDLTPYITPGQTAIIDVDMDPYTNSGGGSPAYIFNGQLVFYSDYEYKTDVSLEDIIAPSAEYSHNRMNPICANPVVRVRNMGKNLVSSILFKYGVTGGSDHFITWNGTLKPEETKDITLASVNWAGSSKTNSGFDVEIVDVNNGPDGNSGNNSHQSRFNIPPVYPKDFVIYFKSNIAGTENSYLVKDQQGNTVLSRSGFGSNFVYRDTLRLNPGCYRFEFDDAGGDGLYFFANNAGTGILRFLNLGNGSLIKNFVPEFGTKVVQEFTTGWALPVEEKAAVINVQAYPNPTSGMVSIDLASLAGLNKSVKMVDAIGREYQVQAPLIDSDTYEIDMSEFAQGLYFITIGSGSSQYLCKISVTR